MVAAQDLAGQRWVGFRTRTSRESFVQFLNRTLAAVGLEEPEIVPIDNLMAQKRLVEANFGIALLAESNVADELKRGTLRKLNVRGLRETIAVALIHRRDGYLGAAAQNFMSALLRRPKSMPHS